MNFLIVSVLKDPALREFIHQIAFLHKIDVKNMAIGLTIPDSDVRDIGVARVFRDELIKERLLDKFIYVKIDTHGGRKQSTLIKYHTLPPETQRLKADLDGKMKEANAKLGEISHLMKGWDGYSAPPIRDDSKKATVKLLRNILLLIGKFNLKKLSPNIVPLPNGNLQLEWETDDKYLEIETKSEKNYHILKTHRKKESEFDCKDYREALDSIYWLLKR